MNTLHPIPVPTQPLPASEPLRSDTAPVGVEAEIGPDLYRARNIAWTRCKMVALRADRVWAVRDGATKEVAAIDAWLAVYRRSLADLGASA